MAEQAARRNHDFGRAFDCLTPNSQKFVVGMILSGIGFNNGPGPSAKKSPTTLDAWKAHLQEMEELARRHGVKVEALPDDVPPLDSNACIALAARFPVDNPREFFAEYWQLFTDVQSQLGKQLSPKDFTLAATMLMPSSEVKMNPWSSLWRSSGSTVHGSLTK
jgi:hypothetical protein